MCVYMCVYYMNEVWSVCELYMYCVLCMGVVYGCMYAIGYVYGVCMGCVCMTFGMYFVYVCCVYTYV